VLRYKRLLKEQKQAQLFKAYQEYFQQQQELDRLEILLEQGRQRLLSGKISPAMMLHKTAYLELIAQQVSSQMTITEAARQRMLECRQLVVEADKEQQVLEKLKQRQREVYQHDVEMKLQNELDEVASSAFLRRS
jgi:flagellar export protein FliJ